MFSNPTCMQVPSFRAAAAMRQAHRDNRGIGCLTSLINPRHGARFPMGLRKLFTQRARSNRQNRVNTAVEHASFAGLIS